MGINIGFAVIHIGIESMVRNQMHQHFDLIVLVQDCFWHLMFLNMGISMMWLFRPTKESKSYAYVQQLPSQDPDSPFDVKADCEMNLDVVTLNTEAEYRYEAADPELYVSDF